jgi:hypothetical protein
MHLVFVYIHRRTGGKKLGRQKEIYPTYQKKILPCLNIAKLLSVGKLFGIYIFLAFQSIVGSSLACMAGGP